jgi:hypothetical protein
MATDRAKDVALRSIEFVRNQRNIQALEEATTPDFVDHLEVSPDATAMGCGRFWSRHDRHFPTGMLGLKTWLRKESTPLSAGKDRRLIKVHPTASRRRSGRLLSRASTSLSSEMAG